MMWTIQPRSDVGGHPAITRGAGPNVLMLHGVGLRAEAWGAQFDLPGRITAPDMPGHGESGAPGSDLVMDDFVKAAVAVLSQLDGPAVVIGHSMGAMLALELAIRMPEKVRAVAALSAIFDRTSEAAHAVQGRASALDGTVIPDQTPTLERWFGAADSPERQACAAWLTQVDPAGYKSAYTAFAHSHVPDRQHLSQLRCPALFLTGEGDPNSTPAMSHAMARCAPKGRAKVIDGAAHMMPMTHPTEVNAALTPLIQPV